MNSGRPALCNTAPTNIGSVLNPGIKGLLSRSSLAFRRALRIYVGTFPLIAHVYDRLPSHRRRSLPPLENGVPPSPTYPPSARRLRNCRTNASRTRSLAKSGPIDRKSVSERIILSASSAGASFLRTASRADSTCSISFRTRSSRSSRRSIRAFAFSHLEEWDRRPAGARNSIARGDRAAKPCIPLRPASPKCRRSC